jgi:hypothetical protein
MTFPRVSMCGGCDERDVEIGRLWKALEELREELSAQAGKDTLHADYVYQGSRPMPALRVRAAAYRSVVARLDAILKDEGGTP